MMFNTANISINQPPLAQNDRHNDRSRNATITCRMPRHRLLPLAAVAAAVLMANMANPAAAQSLGALVEPQATQPQKPVKPMTPERSAWLKKRCSQLVAFFDYYGVSRGENSDGPRNHTRIGATIECERTHYRTGIDTMAALLKRKAFDVPAPGTPAIEPEDVEAPDITNPTRSLFRF